MSITTPKGVAAVGVAAGIKPAGTPDLALAVDQGPSKAAAGALRSNRVAAAPVVWTKRAIAVGRISATILNSGGANACTGRMDARTHRRPPTRSATSSTSPLTRALAQRDGWSAARMAKVPASAAGGITPPGTALDEAARCVCADLARQLIADAEGATKDIRIDVIGAASEQDAVEVGRAVARDNLFKCAIYGEDPPGAVSCPPSAPPAPPSTRTCSRPPSTESGSAGTARPVRTGTTGEDRHNVSPTGRDVVVTADLATGSARATIRTNDLSVTYVHENSAYSS